MKQITKLNSTNCSYASISQVGKVSETVFNVSILYLNSSFRRDRVVNGNRQPSSSCRLVEEIPQIHTFILHSSDFDTI